MLVGHALEPKKTEVSGSLELELHPVVSHNMGAGNQIQVLCKSKERLRALNH